MFFDCSQFIVFGASGEFFSFQANSIYLISFFLFERAYRDVGHHRAHFFELSFLLLDNKDVYVTRTTVFGAFFESWDLCSPFALKKVTNLKKELCGAPHLGMLFLTKKKKLKI